MLIKSDFDQIRRIVREEIENEAQSIKDDLGTDINHAQLRIRSEIGELKDRIKNLEIRIRRMNNEAMDDEEDL